MAATTAIKAGRAFVELFADDSKLARGLKSAQTCFIRAGADNAGTSYSSGGGVNSSSTNSPVEGSRPNCEPTGELSKGMMEGS